MPLRRLVVAAAVLALGLFVTPSAFAAEIFFEEGIEYADPDNQHLKLNLGLHRNEHRPRRLCPDARRD